MNTIRLSKSLSRIPRHLSAAILYCAILIFGGGCKESVEPEAQPDFIRFVNPKIGTDRMGHTFPGATVPFGMVQLSPDTDTIGYVLDGKYNPEIYEYCAGYQFGDPTIVGFSHTHFSGTGHSDLGDFLIMPTTGALQLNPGTADNPESGYRSRFAHENETAEPNYYKVSLEDHGILAELTTSTRVGFHRYTFPGSDTCNIIFDLMHGIYNYEGKNVWTFLRVENDTLLTGWRQTSGWARTRTVYFAMAFDQPIASYGHKKYDPAIYRGFYRKFNELENFPEMAGREIRAFFRFEPGEDKQVKIKFALSPVSTAGAINNMKEEIPHWDFEKVKLDGQQQWNNELAKIDVEMMDEDDRVVFYTALYHTLLSPVVYEDVDGSYRGLDQNIHQSDGFTNYTIFSLWDTYRALHPLFNLLQSARNNDMIHSMLAHQEQSVHRMLPIWSHYANENWCMIGYHAVAVIADALIKGNTDVDLNRALQACVQTSNVPYFDGLGHYMRLGYVPEDLSSSSVSKTLEYAYNDWCIAQIAKLAGDNKILQVYEQRSKNYLNVFDPASGFMRPRLSDGSWRSGFDPLDTHGQGFIEGNALNYGLYVPHEIENMIEIMGGKDAFSAHLDQIFTIELDEKYIEKNEDITRDGIIGAYVHGNEPGHHIAYLYKYTNEPWKTQERVRMIMKTMYANTPNGLCGNDDAGQMSAWYIFSALGFYPVLPGSDRYEIGSPLIKKARLRFENGKELIINTMNQSPENVYVQKVLVNGHEISRHYLTHKELIAGGEIVFVMGSRP